MGLLMVRPEVSSDRLKVDIASDFQLTGARHLLLFANLDYQPACLIRFAIIEFAVNWVAVTVQGGVALPRLLRAGVSM